MSDPFAGKSPIYLIGPITGHATVTPNDDDDLDRSSRGLWVGTGGDVKLTLVDGTTAIWKNVADGKEIVARVARVWSTDTTATDILALY